jgi:flagellar biosynthesis protein FlhG
MTRRVALNDSARGGKPARPAKAGARPRRDRTPTVARDLKVVGRGPATPEAESADHPVRWHRPRARTLVITSGKGGVGKSNLAANLAVALGERGARVLLLDADLAQASLDLLLGLHPRFDLQHVLSGEKALEDILIEGPPGVTLIPASSGIAEMAEIDDYRRECLLRGLGNLDRDFDLILIDTASGISRQVTAFCRAADEAIVVTTPEMPAFSDAYGLIKLLHQQGIAHVPRLLVNMAGTSEEAEETAQRICLVARRFLSMEIPSLGYVPFDPAIGRAVRSQEPVVNVFPHSPAAIAYRALAERLWEPVDPDSHRRPLASHKLEA